jgi:hypothetical protein
VHGAVGANAARAALKQHVEPPTLPSTILRFGRLTEEPGTGHIDTLVRAGAPVTTSRDDAATGDVEALERSHVARPTINGFDGDRRVGDALDAVEPRPLPAPERRPRGAAVARSGPAETRPTTPT